MTSSAGNEEWRDVVEFEDLYEVSNLGRVRNKETKHILKPETKLNGYIEYHLSKYGRDWKRRAHKLVLEAFTGKHPGLEVNHIDHDKGNNRLDNLEWCTHAENVHKAAALGFGRYGDPKRVLVVETGQIFDTAGDAAEELFGNRKLYNHINQQINGYKKSYRGYHFERLLDGDIAMGGKMSREKGKRGEREVANILKERGYDAKRGVQYQGSPDSPDVVGLPGAHIEVKRTERFDLYSALEQCIGDSGSGETPVVVHRKNNKDWVAVLRLEDFLDLYEKRP